MDKPDTALEMLRKFLNTESFEDVVLPSEGPHAHGSYTRRHSLMLTSLLYLLDRLLCGCGSLILGIHRLPDISTETDGSMVLRRLPRTLCVHSDNDAVEHICFGSADFRVRQRYVT